MRKNPSILGPNVAGTWNLFLTKEDGSLLVSSLTRADLYTLRNGVDRFLHEPYPASPICWNCSASAADIVTEPDPNMMGLTDRVRCTKCDEMQETL